MKLPVLQFLIQKSKKKKKKNHKGIHQAARLHCPAESLYVRGALQLLNPQRDVDLQAEYHIPLGVDGGAWLGQADPRSSP